MHQHNLVAVVACRRECRMLTLVCRIKEAQPLVLVLYRDADPGLDTANADTFDPPPTINSSTGSSLSISCVFRYFHRVLHSSIISCLKITLLLFPFAAERVAFAAVWSSGSAHPDDCPRRGFVPLGARCILLRTLPVPGNPSYDSTYRKTLAHS